MPRHLTAIQKLIDDFTPVLSKKIRVANERVEKSIETKTAEEPQGSPLIAEVEFVANIEEVITQAAEVYTTVYQQLFIPINGLLHKSILAGEYYQVASLAKLSKIIAGTKELDQLWEGWQYHSYVAGDLLAELIEYFEVLHSFSQRVQNRLQFNQRMSFITEDISEREMSHENLHLIVQSLEEMVNSSDDDNQVLQYERLLFRLNLKLAHLDTVLHCSKEVLFDLISVRQYLRKGFKSDLLPLNTLLLDKCSYLLYKIITRLGGRDLSSQGLLSDNSEQKFYQNHQSSIVVDGEELKITGKDIVYFQHFFALTTARYKKKLHFSYENDKGRITELEAELFTNLRKDEVEHIDFVQIHELSQLYLFEATDVPHVLDKVNELFQLVYDKSFNCRVSELGSFDTYAYHTLIAFLYFNKLRTIRALFLHAIRQKDHANILAYKSKLDSAFEKMDDVEKKTSIHSYHGYRTYIKCYIEYLNYELEVKRSDFSIDQLNIEVKKVAPQFLPLTRNIEWAEVQNQLTLYLPYQQSFVPPGKLIHGEDFQLFLDSSYILPIHIESLRKEQAFLYDVFQEKRILLTHELIGSTKDALTDSFKPIVQDTKAEVQDMLHHNQIRNIEVLSLFTAILAFVLVGVGTLPKFDDFYVMFLFMYGTAICLGVFVVLIDYILRRQFNRTLIRVFIAGILLFVVLLLSKMVWRDFTRVPFGAITHKDSTGVGVITVPSENKFTAPPVISAPAGTDSTVPANAVSSNPAAFIDTSEKRLTIPLKGRKDSIPSRN